MPLLWTLLAIALSMSAALLFRLTFPWQPRGRLIAWVATSLLAGLSPCLVSLETKPLRLFATFMAIATLAKLYDLWRRPQHALNMPLFEYAVYFTNWFWLVLGKRPPDVPAAIDRRQLLLYAPIILIMGSLTCAIFWTDWSSAPFAVEHAVKAVTLGITVITSVSAIACVWRLAGGIALEPMRNPAVARTPADTWRRWNRPAQQFFEVHAYAPLLGRGRLYGIFMAFLVSAVVHEYVLGIAAGRFQGWQFLFFSLHGVATALTSHLRPRGWQIIPAILATLAFNIAMLAIFAQSVAQIVPFYSAR